MKMCHISVSFILNLFISGTRDSPGRFLQELWAFGLRGVDGCLFMRISRAPLSSSNPKTHVTGARKKGGEFNQVVVRGNKGGERFFAFFAVPLPSFFHSEAERKREREKMRQNSVTLHRSMRGRRPWPRGRRSEHPLPLPLPRAAIELQTSKPTDSSACDERLC